MGGGPWLLELATKYADRIFTVVPEVFWTPKILEAGINELKGMVEQAGRAPDALQHFQGDSSLSLVLPIEDAVKATESNIEICALIKQNNTAG